MIRVRRRSPRLVLALATSVLVAVLPGCTTPSVTAPGGSTGTAPLPTSAASPTPAVSTSPPAVVVAFGGDCSSMLTAPELDDAFATTVAADPYFWPIGAIEAHGGLRCGWYDPNQYMGVFALTWALPASLLSEEQLAWADGVAQCGSGCWAATVEGDVWYAVSVFKAANVDAKAPLVEGLLQRVAAHGAEAAVPVAPARQDGWWDAPGCNAVADGFGDGAGLFSAPVREGDVAPFDRSTPVSVASAAVGELSCQFQGVVPGSGTSVGFTITLAPGAAPGFDTAVSRGAGTVAADGAVRIADLESPPFVYEGSGPAVLAADGANLLMVQLGFGDGLPKAAEWAAGLAKLMASLPVR